MSEAGAQFVSLVGWMLPILYEWRCTVVTVVTVVMVLFSPQLPSHQLLAQHIWSHKVNYLNLPNTAQIDNQA